MFLSEKADNSRNNNLDLIRLIAAALVIWSHAYPIIGSADRSPLTKLTNGQLSFGDLGVAIFFVISGFLVSQSMFRLNELKAYTKARLFRIFPGLAFCVLISTFLIGPFFSTLSLSKYFSSDETYRHLIAITTLNFLSPFLPGVFEENPYGAYINGSLWTLKYEVICYFTLAATWKLGLIKPRRTLLIIAALVLLYSISNNEHLTNLAKLSLYFFAGVFLYQHRKIINLNYKTTLACGAALIVSSYSGQLTLAFAAFGSYIIVYLGYRWPEAINCTKHGDLSYGLYIYGWPVQQMLIATFTDMTVAQNIIFSIALTIPLAYASWHCVEKPFMRLRKYELSNLLSLKNLKPKQPG